MSREKRQKRRFGRRAFLRTVVGTVGVVGIGRSVRGDRRERWRFDTGGAVFSSPSVLGDTVYVGSQSAAVYAVDVTSGEKRWRFETGGPVNSSPLVAVLAGEGSTAPTETVFVGSNDGRLYAIDAESGDELWSFETEGPVQASPILEDGTVFLTSDHDGIYAVDAESGTEQWSRAEPSVMLASPTAAGETVFVRADTLLALDSQNGWERWRTDIGSGTYSSPTVADGTVYIGDRELKPAQPDSTGNLHAIDARSGSKEWEFETDEFVDSTPTVASPGPSMAPELAFVGGWQADIGESEHGGSVHAVETRSGTSRWQFETGGRVVSSPTVADGTVFAGSWDRAVYALAATSGEMRWRFETGGRVSSSPVVVDGTAFVGSNDGSLYAIDAGIAGSSRGSRVRTRTLGHYRTDDIDTTLVPEGELNTRDAIALGAGAVAGLVSGAAMLRGSRDD